MSVASMPMYDMPEVSGALDSLWAAVVRNLEREGVGDVPKALVHGRDLHDLWSDPELLLSQCCGFDIVKGFTRVLWPIATPRYSAPGCDGINYASVVVVRENLPADSIECLRGKICAVNGPGSHSGMNALRALVAPHQKRGRFFAEVHETGAHCDSLAMVGRGEADVAAIDCVTYALLARYRPEVTAGTRKLCYTDRAPGLPYVMRVGADETLVERMQAALAGAFADPGLADARDALFLAGLEILSPSIYFDLVDFERRAVEHGYPKLM